MTAATGNTTDSTAGNGGADVLFERRGRLGVAILNRPRAVNALTAEMVDLLLRQLTTWAGDDGVATVLVQGAGERGLCAGGDIVAIYQDMLQGGNATAGFWQTEYRLNSLISRYPKPYVALMDGLVLGGGVGVSAHGNVRVVTERTRMGMPETTIGFAPDVGGTFLLSHAPGETGTHAALTGAHLGAGDALFLGLADHYVPSSSVPSLMAALETESPEDAVARYAGQPPASVLAGQREWIDACYDSDDAGDIVARLRAWTGPGQDDATAAADTIEAKSPTSVKVTLASLRRASSLTLDEVLAQEYRVGIRFLGGPDFREGIRAQVVDKDRNPQWKPATLAEVLPQDVDRFFQPLDGGELDLQVKATDHA
ncbi:enoyl-CoA hydratase/isomerase family protein [Arthrobacter sp. FW306-05-C]|uniref:enoyl-CoA hydratase/isomerase family protein n=1 Tax=Arthrobacter TaxID=1663 RepID=UPI001EF0E0F1|nr:MULTISPECIES: enoyl-CoA hydratase/isomerase family protein [Arthrobacter]MDP9986057.1 enoyl-CoA hydratase [Arthrobacter oryzae]UKA67302.1 enoyl-CoA hydratase/isomerase family protein [Arthrobacter sp. FW306-05-C]UKA71769.1 enoyl-CoA hydratase/isomerase family protein [Arthrobacter sp. FW306-06-A]UKA75935.1 enoyl-CoA hydratase/isomerase family protein [Arthrobacter sp. FW306-07-I]